MPCPYNIILGRETAVPSPLYHSGVTGIDITGQLRTRQCRVPTQINPKLTALILLAETPLRLAKISPVWANRIKVAPLS